MASIRPERVQSCSHRPHRFLHSAVRVILCSPSPSLGDIRFCHYDYNEVIHLSVRSGPSVDVWPAHTDKKGKAVGMRSGGKATYNPNPNLEGFDSVVLWATIAEGIPAEWLVST